jgi:nucleoid DNA-binding protein
MATTTRVGLEVLSKRSGVSSESIQALFTTIVTLLEEGRRVTIPRFGAFQPAFTEPREISSPVIPKGTRVKRRRKVKFSMSESLREKWVLEATD